ncbi:hemerythrin domain-containing protein [Croceicoccus sediminis]|uniref:hemerythrin domain-containing protein n=1 Tax=Croceicoccus sediminis TaxID=2571150 RepID=UPI0011845CC3|nr:hemerythrin domain-containing protein [Croceicoccus sediminis]
MDIVDCILADHDRQRRMFCALDEARADLDSAGKIFGRLKNFLEAHAAAEELYFYPELLKLGKGAVDSDSAEETTDDAIDDHNKIAKAVEKASKLEVGSDEWWDAVDEGNLQNSKHMAEEERQGLSDFRRNVPLERRVQLGVKYLAFESEHSGKFERTEKDPDEYIKENT